MTRRSRFVRSPAWWLVLCCLAAAPAAMAQQQPLTGARMGNMPASDVAPLAPPAALPPATSPFPASTASDTVVSRAPTHREVGDATRALIRMQSAGTYAAPARPMLGDQASLAYQRYLDSFKHPIPERFDVTFEQQQGQEH